MDADNESKQGTSSEIGRGKPPREHCFKPGQSGNPKGHAKGVPNIASKLRKFGRWRTPEQFLAAMQKLFPEVKELKIEDAGLLRAWVAALQGEPWAIEFVYDRLYGKPKASLDVTSAGNEIKQSSVTYNILDPAWKDQIEKFHESVANRGNSDNGN